MINMLHMLDIQIDREKWAGMTPEERQEFVDNILDSLTPEQMVKMAEIGRRVVRDDITQRAEGRSRTALRTMARAVNVTVNGDK
jgi:hypothetical protein